MRATALALTFALAGCVSSDTAAPMGQLWGTSWVAETIGGKVVAPPGVITLTFGDGTVNGNGGCNIYGGGVTVKGSSIKFGNLASTMMACTWEQRMEQEFAFHEILKDAAQFERPTPHRLDIIAPGGRRIVFTAKH
jgi:putative lipoprotein